ncbi:MAG: DUF3987 domain-containing protein [Ignavibacteria bacterium]|nr:DUF3987 domain-containing protein [Ignavibacteria bacterium]
MMHSASTDTPPLTTQVALLERVPTSVECSYGHPHIEYSALPLMLKRMTIDSLTPDERIALLMASVVVLGSLMPTVTLNYHDTPISPMIYMFVVSQAGAGKSCIIPARHLVSTIEAHLHDINSLKKQAYDLEYAAWTRKGKKHGEAPPEVPTYQYLTIPGDSTGPVLVRQLSSNPSALMFDTEADALATSLSRRHGSSSSNYRKAFHHEHISHARVGESLRLHCSRPCLAIVLSGTPNQVISLVESVENGLCSRIAFITLPNRPEFTDPFSAKRSSPLECAQALAPKVHQLWYLLKDRSFTVALQTHQQQEFTRHFSERFEYDDDTAVAITLRAGVITARIAMVLTVVRAFENDQLTNSELLVSDADFTTAMALGEYLRQSSGDIVNHLRSTSPYSHPNSRQQTKRVYFLQELPDSFSTSEAIELGIRVGLSSATVKRYLADDTIFNKVVHGWYTKRERHPP